MGKIPPPTSGDYPELPEKEWFEVKIKSIDPYDDTRFPKPDGTPAPRFEIILEPTDPELAASHIWVRSARSWDDRSNLYKIAQATFPKPLANEELYEVDTDDLIDKVLMVMGKYAPEDTDHKFLKPTDYKSVAKPATRSARPAAAAAKAAPKAAPADDGDIDI
ncbi:MAG TPA: hypothetical protein VI172_03960 [Candidatus Dormibacteraeota bacterium]